MYRKMLVPLDGSTLAEVVFTYAKELAGRLDLEVILLHVTSPTVGEFLPMRRAYIEQAANTVGRQSRAVQKKTGIEAEGQAVKAYGELVVGYPAEEILRYADEKAIDLILMATHGASGRKRWTLGSVADKVLRASKVPVWLVRPGTPEEPVSDQWTMKTMLVPLDGSEIAESVLPHVEILAKQRGTEPMGVVLLRVCEPPTTPIYYGADLAEVPLNWGQFVQQETERGKRVAKEYLAKIEKRLKDINISVRSEMLVGKASDTIVDYAKKNTFDLIVMATHGRSGLSRLVYGSVAANILHGISSPIFLVKPR
ncbi:MAG: universal stress protein [Chloroflexi bacterium]|nr:universal stress protein [Chloroflexota bacterium]